MTFEKQLPAADNKTTVDINTTYLTGYIDSKESTKLDKWTNKSISLRAPGSKCSWEVIIN